MIIDYHDYWPIHPTKDESEKSLVILKVTQINEALVATEKDL